MEKIELNVKQKRMLESVLNVSAIIADIKENPKVSFEDAQLKIIYELAINSNMSDNDMKKVMYAIYHIAFEYKKKQLNFK